MSADDINFEELSTKFEAVKLGMRHTKDGHVISLAINPHDTPQSLMSDPLGQRYLVVVVRLDGNDQPVASPSDEEGKRAVALAGTLCNDANFIEWLAVEREIDEATEMAASVWLRKYLGIQSRKELRYDEKARVKLAGLRDEFKNALRRRTFS